MKIHLGKFKSLVRFLGPVVLAAVPGGDKIAEHVDVLLGAIEEAEQIRGATGAEKKAHVLAIVAAGVTEANASGKVHLDPAAAQAIAAHAVDAIVTTVKAVHAAPAPIAADADISGAVPAGGG